MTADRAKNGNRPNVLRAAARRPTDPHMLPAYHGRTMKTLSTSPHSWSTSSYGGAADTSPMELSALEDHLGHCKAAYGRLFALHCAAERLNSFMASRFVTTLVLAGLLIGAGLLLS